MRLLKKPGFIIVSIGLFAFLTMYLYRSAISESADFYSTVTLINVIVNVELIFINRHTLDFANQRFTQHDNVEKIIYQPFIDKIHLGNQLGLFFGTIGLSAFVLLLLALPISVQAKYLLSALTTSGSFLCSGNIFLSEMMDYYFRRLERM